MLYHAAGTSTHGRSGTTARAGQAGTIPGDHDYQRSHEVTLTAFRARGGSATPLGALHRITAISVKIGVSAVYHSGTEQTGSTALRSNVKNATQSILAWRRSSRFCRHRVVGCQSNTCCSRSSSAQHRVAVPRAANVARSWAILRSHQVSKSATVSDLGRPDACLFCLSGICKQPTKLDHRRQFYAGKTPPQQAFSTLTKGAAKAKATKGPCYCFMDFLAPAMTLQVPCGKASCHSTAVSLL